MPVLKPSAEGLRPAHVAETFLREIEDASNLVPIVESLLLDLLRSMNFASLQTNLLGMRNILENFDQIFFINKFIILVNEILPAFQQILIFGDLSKRFFGAGNSLTAMFLLFSGFNILGFWIQVYYLNEISISLSAAGRFWVAFVDELN